MILVFNTPIPVNFQLVEAPHKFFFSYGVKMHRCNFLNVLHVLKDYS